MQKPKKSQRNLALKSALGGDSSTLQNDPAANEPATKEAVPVVLPVLDPDIETIPPAEVLLSRPDCRGLKEPARTRERLKTVIYDPALPHGARCAAAALVLAFEGVNGPQLVSVSKVLPASAGYSPKLRYSALKALTERGYITYKTQPAKGCIMELLF